jgi:hypothetical protein
MDDPLLPRLFDRQIFLVIAPRPDAREILLNLAARLALRGPVDIFDGGNWFDAFNVARAVRRFTADLDEVISRIRVSRAFTCYQMTTLLEIAPISTHPILALDLLATFYDESVTLSESQRLLDISAGQLLRLSQAAPVLVSASPPSRKQDERLLLLIQLQQITENLLILEDHQPPKQTSLFSLPSCEE